MATLTIRNLDEAVKRRLGVRAGEHGRSMEDEVREILREAVSEEQGGPDLVASPPFERASQGSEASSSSFQHANHRWSTDVLVLDTNVISELMRPTPSPMVTTWLALQMPHDVFLAP